MLYLHVTFEGIVIEATVEVFGLIAVISYLNLCPMTRLVQQAVFMFASSPLS